MEMRKLFLTGVLLMAIATEVHAQVPQSNLLSFLKPGGIYYARTAWGTWYYFKIVAVDNGSLTITNASYALEWYPDFMTPATNHVDHRWPSNMQILWPVTSVAWATPIGRLP